MRRITGPSRSAIAFPVFVSEGERERDKVAGGMRIHAKGHRSECQRSWGSAQLLRILSIDDPASPHAGTESLTGLVDRLLVRVEAVASHR
jgi:hypothetical protein